MPPEPEEHPSRCGFCDTPFEKESLDLGLVVARCPNDGAVTVITGLGPELVFNPLTETDPTADLDVDAIQDKVLSMEDDLSGLQAQVGIMAAAHGDNWPGGLPPRPETPCRCEDCHCTLHVFPHTDEDVCAWCRRGEHRQHGGGLHG